MIVDTGLKLVGVPFGVEVGVDAVLSNLAFLEPDLGVMFEFMNALTGVEMSSFRVSFDVRNPSHCVLLGVLGDTSDTEDPARRGETSWPMLLRRFVDGYAAGWLLISPF